ncbi:hypothetical protein CEXT_482581 [Caerostris extrusa]|uniref:Uncharacterized protein n=1 Tax=Caerostris extrusa TaxID=172846 RepID=A0AAV4R6N7_CAEEX|nr:hypothetical protein CEXT_482581 [Caerostris extrusa]
MCSTLIRSQVDIDPRAEPFNQSTSSKKFDIIIRAEMAAAISSSLNINSKNLFLISPAKVNNIFLMKLELYNTENGPSTYRMINKTRLRFFYFSSPHAPSALKVYPIYQVKVLHLSTTTDHVFGIPNHFFITGIAIRDPSHFQAQLVA